MMNSSGWIRGLMSKNMSGEKYLIQVGETIERQLKEWDANYEVFIWGLADYVFIVKNGETYYETSLTEEKVESLQNRSPFSLDGKIWRELGKQGLPIIKGYGDYLDKVFQK